MLHVVCVVLSLLAQEPQGQAVVSPKELAQLLSPHKHERVELLKHYHGKPIRLTGKAFVWEGQIQIEPAVQAPKAKYISLRVRFANPDDVQKVRKFIEQNRAKRLETILDFTGLAEFVQKQEALARDYVVPDELRPRARVLSPDEVWRQMQAGSDPRIMADARKKGKIVVVEECFPYWLRNARAETPVPKKAAPSKVDPEKTAAARLALAKQLLGGERTRDAGLAKLREIVSEYPGTAAAKEATVLIKNP